MTPDTEDRQLTLEFEGLKKFTNVLPNEIVDVIYVFSGPEKHRLIGAARDRLEAAVALWDIMKRNYKIPPVFLYQGDKADEYPAVQRAFTTRKFSIDDNRLILRPMTGWISTIDQFTQIPKSLKSKKSWIIVTSPWHFPRTRRYAQKYWPDKKVFYWLSPYRNSEFNRHTKSEIAKIINYAKKGDLSW